MPRFFTLRFAAALLAIAFLIPGVSSGQFAGKVTRDRAWEYCAISSWETSLLKNLSAKGWELDAVQRSVQGQSLLVFRRPVNSGGADLAKANASETGKVKATYKVEEPAAATVVAPTPVKWQYRAFSVKGRFDLNNLFGNGWEPVLTMASDSREGQVIVMRKELKPGETPEVASLAPTEIAPPAKKSGPLPATLARRILDELKFDAIVAKGGIEYGVSEQTFRRLSDIGKIVVDQDGAITVSRDPPIPLDEPLIPQKK